MTTNAKQEDTATRRVRLKTTELPKPLYAAAGAGDLAYQGLRKLPEVAARTVRTAGQTADELRQKFAAQEETVGTRVRASAERGRTAMRNTAAAAQERAAAGYRNLVERGERMITERAGATPEEGAKVEVEVGPVQPNQPNAGQSEPKSAPQPGEAPGGGTNNRKK